MRHIRNSICGFLLAGFLLPHSVAEPIEVSGFSAQEIILAIDHAQRTNPASYFPADRFNLESEGRNNLGSFCETDYSKHSEIWGEAEIDGEQILYSIEASKRQLIVIRESEEVLIDLKEASEDASLQVTLLPCATPIGALICVGGGAGYCAWRVHNCQSQQENCHCGVLQVACGICGEGDGVVCAPCNPLPGPGFPPWPPQPPLPPWPDDPN